MALTPDTLLASLHQHLSHHATLLPALHAQLGLPPSALAVELEHLQTTLCEVVESQITKRQQEVNECMRRCDLVERECLELVKCLGGNARNVQSVGELRKVQILPKRYEQLVSNRDKLRQSYQVKFEQFTTLINRLVNLSRILGTTFFPPDALSLRPTDAFGPTSDAAYPHVDVTPERFQRLEKEVVRGKAEINRRLVQLSSTLEAIVWYYSELGMALPSPEVTTEPVADNSGDASGSDLESPASAHRNPAGYEHILARYVARWEEAVDENLEGDTIGVEGVDPTNGLMEWAESLKSELDELKSRRESQIQAIFDQLEVLWKRLGVDESEIDEFVEVNRGSREENVAAYEAELERLLRLKSESLALFISNAREEITALWDELVIPEDERGDFSPFVDDEFTEELLARHEEEINRLKEEKRIKAPILAALSKYYEICDDERALAESAADLNRLLGRGPRDPGRLLREEKMRKRVKKEKPKVLQELLQSISAWELDRGRPFYINGVRIVDELYEAAEAGNAGRKKAPAKAVPARATTPGPAHEPPPTGTRKHAATPLQSGPTKRQRVAATPATGRVTPSQNTNSVSHNGRVPFGTQNINRPSSSLSSHSKGTVVKATPADVPRTRGATIGKGIPGSALKGARRVAPPSASKGASRVVSESCVPSVTQRMQSIKNKESFRPRPSLDAGVFGMGGMKNVGKLGGTGLARRGLVEDSENMFD
ncbi:hypothetical protein FRB99_001544 [Tulasnella sp. 403]|nr:hypothetical protein FRB99_001544 [Tulasnella sp. 403]